MTRASVSGLFVCGMGLVPDIRYPGALAPLWQQITGGSGAGSEAAPSVPGTLPVLGFQDVGRVARPGVNMVPERHPCSWTHCQAWHESKKVEMGCGWRFAFQNQVQLTHRVQSPRACQCPKNSPTLPRLALSWATRPKSEMDPSLGSPLEVEPGACLLSVCCA